MAGAVHGPEGDLRQTPTGEDWWQDSAFCVWHAADAGIGGVLRIGHEIDDHARTVALWFGLVTEDGLRYRRNTAEPLTAADELEHGFGAHGGAYRYELDGDGVRLRVDDEDCHLDLRVEDFYARTDFFPPTAGTLVDDFASAHFECSGAIRGEVVLGGRTYAVDGLCHRDRSWGVRRWDTLLNHRWTPGTVGPELSFGAICWHGIDGSLRRYGYVVRNGEVTIAQDVDVVVGLEPDGTTARDGRLRWTLPDGEVLRIDCTPIDGIVFRQHEVASVDHLCAVTVDGRPGFVDLEVSTNPRGGVGEITAAIGAIAVDGLSERPVGALR